MISARARAVRLGKGWEAGRGWEGKAEEQEPFPLSLVSHRRAVALRNSSHPFLPLPLPLTHVPCPTCRPACPSPPTPRSPLVVCVSKRTAVHTPTNQPSARVVACSKAHVYILGCVRSGPPRWDGGAAPCLSRVTNGLTPLAPFCIVVCRFVWCSSCRSSSSSRSARGHALACLIGALQMVLTWNAHPMPGLTPSGSIYHFVVLWFCADSSHM